MAADSKKKAVWAEVTCTLHGKSQAGGWKPNQVAVPIATTRKERVSGCPMCNMEARNGKAVPVK